MKLGHTRKWTLWLQWVVANAGGWAVGWAVAEPGFSTTAGVTVGVAVATLQWLVLHPRSDWADRFALVSTFSIAASWVAGVFVGTFAALSIGEIADIPTPWIVILSWTLTGTVVGVAVGVAQWTVLRQQVYQAGWWMLTNMIGLGLGLGTSWIIVDALGLADVESIGNAVHYARAVAGAITGITWSMVTGAPLVRLLCQDKAG